MFEIKIICNEIVRVIVIYYYYSVFLDGISGFFLF